MKDLPEREAQLILRILSEDARIYASAAAVHPRTSC